VISIFEFTEIAESTQRILDPLSENKFELLGELLRLGPGMR
jgi:hypothetical protein